jgi:uncharacterized damage-inducible protein DinB
MKHNALVLSLVALSLAAAGMASAQSQRTPPTPARAMRSQFGDISRKLLDMARDFPAEKYNYRPNKDVRSFGEVIVHLTSGNNFAVRAAKQQELHFEDWTELDASKFRDKAQIVAAFEKSVADATEALKASPDERFTRMLYPWSAVIEHAAEHYGQLVVYYRANGLVPPESRKAKPGAD